LAIERYALEFGQRFAKLLDQYRLDAAAVFGISGARFRCLKATPLGFALSSCNSSKEIAIVSLCELGDRAM